MFAGTLYLLFGAYPIVFQQVRGWSEGIGGLPFLGVALGQVLGIGFSGYANKWYLKAAAENGGVAPAEARLPPAFYGAIAVPVGLFWFAWTNSPSIHWISPVLAGVPFGFGFCILFLVVTNYLIDAYTVFAASVLAANTVLRSLFGATFPLFTGSMFDRLGIHWGSSIPAFLALACVPFPFIFYKYGAAIRSRCVYAARAEAAMHELRARAAQSTGPTTVVAASSQTTLDVIDPEKNAEASGSRFEPIKSGADGADRAELTKVKSCTGSITEAANYNASPYDIDRVNTSTSIAGLELSRTRTNKSIDR
jgi:hypothetical protein